MSLTQEQIDGMVALSAPLVENPLPWAELSEAQQGAFRLLMPGPGGFDQMQRYWLHQWWLPVTAGQLDVLNGMMPAGSVIEGRASADGGIYIGADLLSDALDGGPLADLLPVLEGIPLTFGLTIAWRSGGESL